MGDGEKGSTNETLNLAQKDIKTRTKEKAKRGRPCHKKYNKSRTKAKKQKQRIVPRKLWKGGREGEEGDCTNLLRGP